MALQQAVQGEACAFPRSMRVKRFERIGRAAGREAADIGQQRSYEPAIEIDRCLQSTSAALRGKLDEADSSPDNLNCSCLSWAAISVDLEVAEQISKG